MVRYLDNLEGYVFIGENKDNHIIEFESKNVTVFKTNFLHKEQILECTSLLRDGGFATHGEERTGAPSIVESSERVLLMRNMSSTKLA